MRTCAHLRAIPVVLVSAYEPDLDATKQGTVAAHLKKPFGPDELVEVVMSLAPPHLPGRKGSAVGSG
jgi:CheY-like chemotaxis protein